MNLPLRSFDIFIGPKYAKNLQWNKDYVALVQDNLYEQRLVQYKNEGDPD